MVTMIKGIDVILYVKVQTDVDAFYRPVYDESAVTVSNVLVGEPSSESVFNDGKNKPADLSGKRISYTLAIPKGDTHDWEDAEVEFFGKRFKTVGSPVEGIEAMLPLDWNKKITVERYENAD